eukprot:Protomagalhaensia_wolfi_Nauph_80__6333@NODE_989_length_1825_cov_357_605823_g746_i0_p1_GENE_NODE_989_length_1825_cov_357_605823_g746_i0NODE_989_length_1825_cov_357_605823_g746_i0_p1_ORF_typecomplete_len233_score64_69C2/PF00168_30/2_5e16C2/PF00168_30/2_3TTR52/PF01060_23/29TTR52/PF01060_23/17_NODE_989_length_1825_cov_357_605823_g746_i07651463
MKDTDTIGKIDPYLKVTYGSAKKQTKPIKSGGSNCKFNKTIMFPEEHNIDKLSIEVWDADRIGKDDLVGSAEVSLAKVLRSREEIGTVVTLTTKDKKGTILRRGELVLNLFRTEVQEGYSIQTASSQKSVSSEEAVKAPHAKVTVHTCTNIRGTRREAVQPLIKVHCGHRNSATATGDGVNVVYDETLCLPYNGGHVHKSLRPERVPLSGLSSLTNQQTARTLRLSAEGQST